MNGWVKLSKQFSNDEVWFHVTAFRLYVWILLKAAYEDGTVLNGMELKKGQYVRAYSQLSDDLMYIEGRGNKKLAKSTIKRAVDKLVKKGLLLAEETALGTLFTVVNSDQFKCLEGGTDFFCPPFRETVIEQSQNESGTKTKQYIRIKDFKKIRNQHQPTPTKGENGVQGKSSIPVMEERKDTVASQFITLRNNGFFLSPKDEMSIERICQLPVETKKLKVMLEEVFREFHLKNPKGQISSALYCEKAIMAKLENRKTVKKSNGESMSERVDRLLREGKIGVKEDQK